MKMDTLNKQKLISAWIERFSLPENKEKAETAWAYDNLDDICNEDPQLALELIIGISTSTSNEMVIDNLAAGPLEDLLARHGSKVISKIEAFTEQTPEFANVLAGIWENTITPDVLKRVSKLIEKYSTLDKPDS